MSDISRAAKKKRAAQVTPTPVQSVPPRTMPGWLWPALIILSVVLFYWIPLTSADASIQWDAVDTHYSPQKYFSDRVATGELPFWTPYLFSGFPFLADPQVGAWYPLNWPFFLAGITPKGIQAELVLHALLAFAGAFLFFRRLVGRPDAALIGGLFYAFSGFFAEHSSHVGMFSTAACLPWLLLFADRAMEGSAVLRNTILAGVAGGVMILAGHFQTALYGFAALGLFAIGKLIDRPKLALRTGSVLAAIAAIAVLLSMIQTLPGLELTQNSVRAAAGYAESSGRSLEFRGVVNLFLPNATAVFDHPDGSGITDAQYYLYSGFLLIPLAIIGWRMKSIRMPALLLTVLPLWYMLGPAGGLYRIGALLPGFRSVRSPIHFWFVPVFALAMLSAAGAVWIHERWKQKWILPALALVVFADLFYWNSLTNPLAYARYTFADLYGSREQLARDKLLPTVPPLTRFSMPDRLTVFGPLNHPLDLKLEATYGYNPLELSAYAQYRAAMTANPKLQNALGVSRYLDTKVGGAVSNPDALPRAWFARRTVSAPDLASSRTLLDTLDPAQTAIVSGSAPETQPDEHATVSVTADGEQAYRIRYRTAAPALLNIGVAFFPGWEASIDGQPHPIRRVDHALMGVVVPAGDKELRITFRSRWFGAGALVSGLTLLLCTGVCLWLRLRLRRKVDASTDALRKPD